MCFICRVLIAVALARITARLLLYALAAALLMALTVPVRAFVLTTWDTLTAPAISGLVAALAAAVLVSRRLADRAARKAAPFDS
ncbi:hypothetical protein ACIG3E_33035 [Streptomyces sp. NPDC053474]|uniref:hypothetical protein n=1 Tax=Streptomyces sp. NPDC053474 TaxID=3365704 RepID=UPI0037D7AAB2